MKAQNKEEKLAKQQVCVFDNINQILNFTKKKLHIFCVYIFQEREKLQREIAARERAEKIQAEYQEQLKAMQAVRMMDPGPEYSETFRQINFTKIFVKLI